MLLAVRDQECLDIKKHPCSDIGKQDLWERQANMTNFGITRTKDQKTTWCSGAKTGCTCRTLLSMEEGENRAFGNLDGPGKGLAKQNKSECGI